MDYHARAARLTALEPRHVPAVRRALVQQAEVAAAALSHYPPDSPLPAGLGPLLAALVKPDALVLVLQRLYADCGGTEAAITYDTLRPREKALAPPALVSRWLGRLRQFITTEGAQAVRGITNTTRAVIRRSLSDSAAAGQSVADAARQLRQRVAQLAPQRAVRIVRTELVAASNYGSTLGAEATGLRLEKFWIATPDGRTRPEHAAANGQGAPLQGGLFTVGGYHCRYPADPLLPAGERVNCRCAIGYRKVL